MKPQSTQAAGEAGVVPGIYEHCDEWCSYCPMTSRCTAFRRLAARPRKHDGEAFDSLEEAIEFSREVRAAEGKPTPELDALLSPDPVVRATMPEVDDPLDDLATRYAFETSRFLHHRRWLPPVRPTPQPSPIDVVAWYHVLIETRIDRALTSALRSRGGSGDGMMDANGCAKMVLVGIDRSCAALARLRGMRDDWRVASLLETLERLGPAVERRFPEARAFMRPGLDAPVV